MPTNIPIEKTRGDTRRHIFTINSSSGVVDISTWTNFSLSVTSVEDPPDNTTLLETMAGTLLTDGTDGKVYFVPSGTLDVGEWFYDAQALDSNNEKETFVKGPYVVPQDRDKN